METVAELEVGEKYRLILKAGASGFSVVIPNAKFYSLSLAQNGVYELTFHYGECRGTPQSVKLAPGNIFAFEKVDTEAVSK